MRTRITLLFAVVFTLVLNGQQRQTIDPVISAMHTISSHDLLEWVVIQCDDKYAGRLTGTPEYQACAEWLASMFEGWGLTPAGDKGTWFQWFDIPYTLVYPGCGVSLHLNTGKKVTIKMSTQHFPDGRGSNIIGLLKGSDPEFIDKPLQLSRQRCYDLILIHLRSDRL